MGNTGQGVLLEDNPFSHYIHADAAVAQGWINPETRAFIGEIMESKLLPWCMLRPNLIIYLDAHSKTVMKNIAAKGDEWNKNSPVWTNKSYLDYIYTNFKKEYLKKAMRHSLVSVYDWNEPGDVDLVIEDIEKLNFDFYDRVDDQQSDWANKNEKDWQAIRMELTDFNSLGKRLDFGDISMKHIDEIAFSEAECVNASWVHASVEGDRYDKGWSPKMGDKNVFFKCQLFDTDSFLDWNPVFPSDEELKPHFHEGGHFRIDHAGTYPPGVPIPPGTPTAEESNLP